MEKQKSCFVYLIFRFFFFFTFSILGGLREFKKVWFTALKNIRFRLQYI